MTKDDRIVVRMSAELREWVHAQAAAREMDDAAFVRMVLAEARTGLAAPRVQAEAPRIVAQPVVRDVLQIASAPAEQDADPRVMPGHDQEEAPAIDVDDIVAASLAEAEAAGLTQSQIETEQGDMPDAGVRPLMRRRIPFSPGTQSRHLEQMFGGH